MKRITLATYFILVVTCSYGQHKFGIKIYQNTDIFEAQFKEARTPRVTQSDIVNFNRFSLAINIDVKKSFAHEIEFLVPELSKSIEDIQFPLNYEFRKDPTFDGKGSSYSLRYELSKTFTEKSRRLGLNLGIGVNPYYVFLEYIPNVETTYYLSTKLYGLVLNVIPRIKYRISNRVYIDLNMPVRIYDYRTEKIRIKNPAIPISQQTLKRSENIFFENVYTIRLGVTYKFGRQ